MFCRPACIHACDPPMFSFGEKIENVISEALLIDRSGSVVLEHTFHDIDRKMSGMETIGLKETIGVACW
jgi:hypothetical protein